jgi:hypothetical protein
VEQKQMRKIQLAAVSAVASLLVGGVPVGASADQQQSMEGAAAESSTTFYTFPDTPFLAISSHGNVTRYEGPTGYEHIGIGSFSEGYVLCYGPSRAFDTSASESGFAAGQANCTSNKCTITRNTSDGILQLRQVITKNASSDRSFSVAMTVRNLTGASVASVIVRRQVDLDVDTGGALGTAGIINWFGSSERDSVYAWNHLNKSAREEHAVILSSRTPLTIPSLAKVTAAILDSSCSPDNIAAAGPVEGDYGATIQYNLGTLAGGGSKTVTVQYQRN